LPPVNAESKGRQNELQNKYLKENVAFLRLTNFKLLGQIKENLISNGDFFVHHFLQGQPL
jgi:hypothetical protein